MENIVNVTTYLKKKITESGGNPKRETLSVIKTTDGENFYKTKNGNYYRMYDLIENTVSYDNAENPNQLYEAARAFGKFQKMLADFEAEKLHETIPKFHDTYSRYERSYE